jgi:hypothetical protein
LDTTKQNSNKATIYHLLAWFFAILFVITTIGIVFSFFPARRLLSPDLYKQALEDVRVYQKLPETIAEQLATNLTHADGEANSKVYLLLLDETEWESILINLINPDWMQSQTENVIDQIFTILLNSPDPINTPIKVSLLDVKSRLGGQEGSQAFNQILDAQIPCSIDQLMGLLQLGLGMETSIETLLCRPPDYILSELNPVVESFLTAATAQVPDYITFYLPLSTLGSPTPGLTSDINQEVIPEAIKNLRRINTLVSWSPLLPLALIILVTIFAVRTFKDLLQWWGGMLLTAGLISLILSLVLFPIANWGFSTFIPSEISSDVGLTTMFVQMGLGDLSRYLAKELVLSVVIPAGVLAIIGFVLLLGFYFLAKNNSRANTQITKTSGSIYKISDS